MATIAIGISKGGSYTARVPVNSLAEDGVPPEEGDKIQCSVEGTVQSVAGGTATISVDSINGEPVGEEASESPEEEATEEGGETPPAPGAGGGAGGSPNVAASGPGDLAAMRKRLMKSAKAAPPMF